jgi:hypothetical protein
MRLPKATGWRLLTVGVVLAVATGCTGGHPATGPDSAPHTSRSSPAPSSRLVVGCPVTIPSPVPSSEQWRASLFGSDSAYGNGKLWVGALWRGGVMEVGPEFFGPDGGTKFGWYRSVPGTLQITGRRLDGAAPPLRANVPSGYGEMGFQSSGVYFPTPGCWEVTGAMATTSLSFVTLVIRRDR